MHLPRFNCLIALLLPFVAFPIASGEVAPQQESRATTADSTAMNATLREYLLKIIEAELKGINTQRPLWNTDHFVGCCAEGWRDDRRIPLPLSPDFVAWKELLEQLQENPERIFDRSLGDRFTLTQIHDRLDLMYLLASSEQPENLFAPPVPFLVMYPIGLWGDKRGREVLSFQLEMDLRYIETFLDNLNAGSLKLPPEGEPLRPIDLSPQRAFVLLIILTEKMPPEMPDSFKEKLKSFMRRFAATPYGPNLENLYETLPERLHRIHHDQPTERVEAMVENIINSIIVPQDTFTKHVQNNPDYYSEYLRAMQSIALQSSQTPVFNYKELPEAKSFPPDLADFIQSLSRNTWPYPLGGWNLTDKGLELCYVEEGVPDLSYEYRLKVLIQHLEHFLGHVDKQ